MLHKRDLLIPLFAFIVTGTILSQNFKYVGAASCKMCHNKPDRGEQYNKWMEGPHSDAWKVLSSERSKEIARERGIADVTTDTACIKCHSTLGHIDGDLAAGIKIEEGVSCESCHGPGSMYRVASVMKNRDVALTKGLILPTEEVCRRCHKNPNRPFNFEEKVAKIAHADPLR